MTPADALGYTRARACQAPEIMFARPFRGLADLLEPIDAPTPERGQSQVAVAPIGRAVRDQVSRGRLTWSTIALTLGWTYGPGGGADTTRLLRRLGLALMTGGRGYAARQSQYINRELAAAIIRAAHLDPVDVGL